MHEVTYDIIPDHDAPTATPLPTNDTMLRAELTAAKLRQIRLLMEAEARRTRKAPEKAKRKERNRKQSAAAKASRKRNR